MEIISKKKIKTDLKTFKIESSKHLSELLTAQKQPNKRPERSVQVKGHNHS